jgi:uncharacterized protein (TIGR03083 family)
MVGMDGGWQNTFDVFEDTAAAFARLVSEVPAAAWTMPALGVWSVRDLVGHTSRAFSTVESYLAAPATSVDLGSGVDYLLAALASHPQAIADRGRQAGQALGDDPPAAVADLVGRTLATVRAADPDAAVATPFGGIRVRDYLPTRTFELAVHGLDLAAALGLPPTCPPAAAQASLALAGALATRTGRATELLLAATGRRALPAGFNLLDVPGPAAGG